MKTRSLFPNSRTRTRVQSRARFLAALLAAAYLAGGSAAARDHDDGDKKRFCSQTANLIFRACQHEILDDYLIASAKCLNVSDPAERSECVGEARASRGEGRQLCQEQLDGRLEACQSLGEERYDPDLDPGLFDEDLANLTNPNPYFPLQIGYRWEFQGGDEINTLEIVDETKLIEGIRSFVVRDLVTKGDCLAEATDDWFAMAKNGNVWYLGEEVKDFECFEGDDPVRPEQTSIDGSFKAGRELDKPGIIFQASPAEGDVYLEEYSLGNAEDVTEILSTTYAFGETPELDEFVPEELAEKFCSGDCVVTKNFSLLEPGIFARKYYAPGIGFFLEVNPDAGEVLALTGCNVDPSCPPLQ